jgi:peptidoglycan biosynthesis protein MviN/MurJ (putative lipid II flippase)
MSIGDGLHLQNMIAFFIGLLLLIGIIQLGVKNIGESRAWTWIMLWLFLTSSLMFIPSILGDTWALNRHALLSTTIYRLSMWLFTIIVIDIALSKESQTQNEPTKITD